MSRSLGFAFFGFELLTASRAGGCEGWGAGCCCGIPYMSYSQNS